MAQGIPASLWFEQFDGMPQQMGFSWKDFERAVTAPVRIVGEGVQTVARGVQTGIADIAKIEIKWDPLRDIRKSDIGKVGQLTNEIFNNTVEGLGDAASETLDATFEGVKDLGEAVALTARATVGDAKWSEVGDKLGDVSQNIGRALVAVNPLRFSAEVLKKSELTSHAFNELDKFSGGLVTRVVNVSTLPARALRGDPISKTEVIMSVLTIIQVGTMIIGGGAAIGAFVGTQVGQEVCKHQKESAQSACNAAFTILGAATGTGLTQGFTTTVMSNAGITAGSLIAIQQCKDMKLAGRRECEVIGAAARDYMMAWNQGTNMTWQEFLTARARELGEVALLTQMFPEDSPERQALVRQETEVREVKQQFNYKPLLLAAGVASALLIGAS